MVKEIKGFPGYFITRSGRVFSKYRAGRHFKNGPIYKPVELKQQMSGRGYRMVFLTNKNGKATCYIHKLIAQTFIPNPFNKREVNHKDGDKLNNNIKNLEWVTKKENYYHAIRTGLLNNRGENHAMSKLTVKDVIKIRALQKEGKLTEKEIASMFKVCRQCINNIKNHKSWKHIDEIKE